MILVDTNVWSELVRPEPDDAVVAWEQRNANLLWLSTVVVGEFLSGIELMPDGRRKAMLRRTYDEIIDTYADRILAFDLDAGRRYADVLAYQVRHGRAPGTADTQLAASALSAGMALATRNVSHFEGLGLLLIDPWSG